MTKRSFRRSDLAGFVVGAALLTMLAGCITEGSRQARGYQGRPGVQVQTSVAFQDDYDYYPGYEVYYSRNRHEYVYRDGNAWVRRPQPRGITVDMLLATPSVRLDFHDSPEQHHSNVVRSYPRTWKQPAQKNNDKDDHRDDKNDDRKGDDRKNH